MNFSTAARKRGIANIKLQAKADTRQLQKRLNRMGSRAPDITQKVFGQAAEIWRGKSVPVIPMRAEGTGRGPHLRSQVSAFSDRKGTRIEAGLRFGADYAIWLIAGTARIAGGDVMRWRTGDAPITDWPAKREHADPRYNAEMPVALPRRPVALEHIDDNLAKELVKGRK